MLAAAILLAVGGAVIGTMVARVGQSSASTMNLTSELVISSGDLRLWHDFEKTKEATSLEFDALEIQPPLRSLTFTRTIAFVENLSTADLFLVKPCGDVESPVGTKIGSMDAVVHNLFGKRLGNTCDWPPTIKLASGDLAKASLRIDLVPGLVSGDYPFQTEFEAVTANMPIEPPGGMVSWWPGDGNATDIMDGNHGTLTGDATITADGMVGKAFSFDGTGDLVIVPDSTNLNITGDVTVDLWARRTLFGSTTGFNVLVEKGAGAIGVVDAPAVYFLNFTASDQLSAGFERANGSNAELFGPTVTDTEFHHYAYVRSGQTHRLFMDGVVVTADSFTGSPGDTSWIPLTIGALRHDADPSGYLLHFAGVIDEVEAFDRALSDAEIKTIYYAGSSGKIKPAGIQPPEGMVGWWPGDGNASDIMDGNHGTLSGDATATADGIVGQAFSFDGTGDLVIVPDSADLNILGDFTVDVWARRTVLGGGYRYMVVKGAGSIAGSDVPTAYALGFTPDNNLWGLFERADASNINITGPTVADQLFHHYAYVRIGNTHKLFMDGDEVKSEIFTGSAGDTSGLPLVIGALRNESDPTGFNAHFGGVIDEVEIFNRALSAAEIKAIYNAGSAGKRKPRPIEPPEGMVSWWPGDGNANDVQGGNHGMLSGDATATANGMVGQAFSLDGADDFIFTPAS